LAAGVAGHVFPGGSACISVSGEGAQGDLVLAWAGTLAKGEARVQGATRYDLGRITEAFVAIAALRLAARAEIDLDDSVEDLLPDVRGGALAGVSLRALLTHRAGLAAWGGLYLDVPHEAGSSAARRWIVSESARRPNELSRGPIEHSDLSYIVAGEALARAADTSLEDLVHREVLKPLGIADQLGFPAAMPTEKRALLAKTIAPTERCEWRGRLVRAEVHDENAAALGGVAGHAGLFGTAKGVAIFGRAVLDSLSGRSDFVPAALLDAALAEGTDKSPLRLGWEAKSGAKHPCGRRASRRSFGQLAFTGASLWCDPEADVVIALLTNRICPSRANEKIDGFRPAFHDAILALVP
jgi:CubicO group peptidase (beta-lactamase class C family)